VPDRLPRRAPARGVPCARVCVRLPLDSSRRRHRRSADARRGDVHVIVCVAPNPSIDKLFVVERLEQGAIHRPASFVQVPGGKGDGYAQLGDVASLAVDGTKLGGARPALVKVNAAEAAQMTGLPVDTPENALAAAVELRSRSGGKGRAAIVTRGRAGAALI